VRLNDIYIGFKFKAKFSNLGCFIKSGYLSWNGYGQCVIMYEL